MNALRTLVSPRGAVFLLLECVAIAIYVAAGRVARGALRTGRSGIRRWHARRSA